MPITSDLRAYADSAVHQGKQTFSSAQAQFSGVTEQAGEFVNKFAGSVLDGARGNLAELRTSTEKLVNIEALRTALEPYVTQLRGYGDSVTYRAEELVATMRKDPRFGKVFETADSVSNVVVGLVQERVVKPVRSRVDGAASKPATEPATAPLTTAAATKPAKKRAAKPAATRPAARKSAAPRE